MTAVTNNDGLMVNDSHRRMMESALSLHQRPSRPHVSTRFLRGFTYDDGRRWVRIGSWMAPLATRKIVIREVLASVSA